MTAVTLVTRHTVYQASLFSVIYLNSKMFNKITEQTKHTVDTAVTLKATVNGKRLVGLKFGEFGKLCYFHQILFANCKNQFNIASYLLIILDEFAKLSFAEVIHWQIRQILVPPLFRRLWYNYCGIVIIIAIRP